MVLEHVGREVCDEEDHRQKEEVGLNESSQIKGGGRELEQTGCKEEEAGTT